LFLNGLVSVFILSGLSLFSLLAGNWFAIYTSALLGVGPLLLAYYVLPLVKQARESKHVERKWKKLRFHPDTFWMTLAKGNRVTPPPPTLGVIIGNLDAKHEIIKVCNPYCGPCSRAHPVLEQVVRSNPDVKIRVIFRASDKDDDPIRHTAQHFLAIQEKLGSEVVKEAMNNWYLMAKKDYDAFARKYPMNGELENQRHKIVLMKAWCDEWKIRAIPTLFIDGYEYPNEYSIKELKYLF